MVLSYLGRMAREEAVPASQAVLLISPRPRWRHLLLRSPTPPSSLLSFDSHRNPWTMGPLHASPRRHPLPSRNHRLSTVYSFGRVPRRQLSAGLALKQAGPIWNKVQRRQCMRPTGYVVPTRSPWGSIQHTLMPMPGRSSSLPGL